jgi:hypothetical protein
MDPTSHEETPSSPPPSRVIRGAEGVGSGGVPIGSIRDRASRTRAAKEW